MAAVWGYAAPLRILCTREFQSSIRESFHAELKSAIMSHPWLMKHYDVGVDYIRGHNGTNFIFRGLRRNIQSIRSLAQIDLTIIEEAEDVPEESWLGLEPTVFRNPRTEIWAIWNPRKEFSAVDKRFRRGPAPGMLVQELNWSDNPFFPPHMELLRQRDQERLDPNTYAHVWEGAYLVNSNAQVFADKWKVEHITVKESWAGPYHGGDFGYAMDPTAAVRCYIGGDYLFVTDEAGGLKIELDQIAPVVNERIPGFDKHVSRWDSSAPGSISLLQRNGMPKAVAVQKWGGSVEDGIRYLRSFKKIIIDPRCRELINEFRLYSYKVDPYSGDVLPKVIDASNHYIDALRYALAPMILQFTPGRAVFGTYGSGH